MITLKEFSETVVNRSNNSGKLNYQVLSEELGKDFHKDANFIKFGSKSPEKKLLRKLYQAFILNAAKNINSFTKQDKQQLYDLIVKVQGSFTSAKQLYNAKNFEKENLAKALYSALKPFCQGSVSVETSAKEVSEEKDNKKRIQKK